MRLPETLFKGLLQPLKRQGRDAGVAGEGILQGENQEKTEEPSRAGTVITRA